MRKGFCIGLMVFFSVVSIAGAESSSGRVCLSVDLTGHGSGQAAKLWLPYPTTNADQTISNISVQGNFSAYGVYTDAVFETPILYARWDQGVAQRRLTVTFDVTRQEVIRREFPAKEAAWDRTDYSLYLSATRLGPVDGEVKKLADTITAGQKTVLGKAKAIYDWTCENTYRNPETRGCGFGDVYRLLKDPGGKCADISSIYVALARAAGVPSREIFGIRQGKMKAQDITTWYHCWAEFYLPGYGWVPVDPADVRKAMLKLDLDIADPKTNQLREYFWGGLDPYRIKLGEGRDIVLNPAQSGDPVNYLMYPYAEIGSTVLDWLDPRTFSYTVTYTQQ